MKIKYTTLYWEFIVQNWSIDKGNNKITEHRAIFQRERQIS